MKVELEVDGIPIPLNDFTMEIIGKCAGGMAESLRGVPLDWSSIVLKIER
jgi:hypothetical protein